MGAGLLLPMCMTEWLKNNAVYAMLSCFVCHNGVLFGLGTCFAEGYVAWALRSTP